MADLDDAESSGRDGTIWSALVKRGGFSCIDDAVFIAGYLGIPSVRLKIIRLLQQRAWATLPALAADLGWTRNGLLRHVEVLEDLGLLQQFTARVPGSDRPATCYKLDPARLNRVADAAAEALRGTSSIGGPGRHAGSPSAKAPTA
ncbi:helix-turn-helix domain-containing protein [Microbacterium sp. ASV49]|uniref:Helix-turn-helix domain-containing protein n=1 Tax=Microbacterium candidum TaxID=3041922 RepID=A0ABT7MWC6_9MICO|nr:helix-turn-helix domain-containing protein [Microbacterium sp. ASV49]MDL9978752.1 helix-turn-helix domain-containing protein [Microbacterium sp. ASV49]